MYIYIFMYILIYIYIYICTYICVGHEAFERKNTGVRTRRI